MGVGDIRTEIQGELGSSASGVDYVALHEATNLIIRITETALGLFVYLIIIGLPVIIALELVYLNVPIIQNNILEWKDKLGKRAQKVLELILRDAQLAVKKAETVDTGKSANGIYLGIKFKSIFISVVVVAIVLGGSPIFLNLLNETAIAIIEFFFS